MGLRPREIALLRRRREDGRFEPLRAQAMSVRAVLFSDRDGQPCEHVSIYEDASHNWFALRESQLKDRRVSILSRDVRRAEQGYDYLEGRCEPDLYLVDERPGNFFVIARGTGDARIAALGPLVDHAAAIEQLGAVACLARLRALPGATREGAAWEVDRLPRYLRAAWVPGAFNPELPDARFARSLGQRLNSGDWLPASAQDHDRPVLVGAAAREVAFGGAFPPPTGLIAASRLAATRLADGGRCSVPGYPELQLRVVADPFDVARKLCRDPLPASILAAQPASVIVLGCADDFDDAPRHEPREVFSARARVPAAPPAWLHESLTQAEAAAALEVPPDAAVFAAGDVIRPLPEDHPEPPALLAEGPDEESGANMAQRFVP